MKKFNDESVEGLLLREVSALYFEFYWRCIGAKALRNMVDLLIEVGLIIEETDPVDRRRKKIYFPALGG